MAELIIGHTGRKYHVIINQSGIDYMVIILDNKKEYKEFLNSFHKIGDLNEIDGKYYRRSEPESKRYEIFLKTTDDKHFILELMEIKGDWFNSNYDLSINIGFLNGDVRTEEEYKDRLRKSIIDNLLINSK